VRLRGILTGRIYDDRGNRMSPSHSNKLGVRYRYCVSHALLQNRKQEAGSVARVPAPDIEQLVLDAIRAHLGSTEHSLPGRDLIERHLECVIIKPQAVEVRLTVSGLAGSVELHRNEPNASDPIATTLTLPSAAPAFVAVKGIVHEPSAAARMAPETRDALLSAIAKARGWIDDLRLGRAATLAEIAEREGLGERHVRLLAPLAFVAPCIVAVIVDGTAPADLTITGLAEARSYSWVDQERGLSR
jgi:site-specific DNA recombinase